MTFVHTKNTVLLMDATDLTSYTHDSGTTSKLKEHDVTTYGMSDEDYDPGLRSHDWKLKVFWKQELGAYIESVLRSGALITRFPMGDTLGQVAEFGSIFETAHALPAALSSILANDVNYRNARALYIGQSFHARGQESGAGSYTIVDNGAATANGWAALVHVTAIDAATTAVLRLLSSTNNFSTSATLGTFPSITATGAALLLGTGAVPRYLRATLVSLTSGKHITFALSVARL